MNFRELLRIGNGLQNLRQMIRCLNSVHGWRLESAGRSVVKRPSDYRIATTLLRSPDPRSLVYEIRKITRHIAYAPR